MKIEVVFVANGSTQSHHYTCTKASRQLDVHCAQIIFKGGPGFDEKGRKVISAQYREAAVIITYEDSQ